MKNLDLNNYGVQEMNAGEKMVIFGGGKWSWGEAAVCFAVGGLIGVGAYYLGTQQ